MLCCFFGMLEQILRASTKNVSAVFLKVPSICAQERSRCFFSSLRYQFSGILNKFLSLFEWKKIALISKLQDTFAKEQLGKFCHKKQFFNQVIRARSFHTRSENLRKKSAFVFFCIERAFSYFFPRDIGFLSDCALKSSRLQQKSFQQCFSKCIQDVEDSVFVFSWLFFFHISDPEHFLPNFQQKSFGSFHKTEKYLSRWTVWFFLSKSLFAFSDCWDKVYERLRKMFEQCFWKCLKVVHKNVLVVFFSSKILFLSDSEQVFSAVWVKKTWQWSQNGRIRSQRNNLVNFTEIKII